MQTLHLCSQGETDINIALIRTELTAEGLKDYEAKGQVSRFWEQYSAINCGGHLTTEVSGPTIKAAIWTKGAIWTGSMNISSISVSARATFLRGLGIYEL